MNLDNQRQRLDVDYRDRVSHQRWQSLLDRLGTHLQRADVRCCSPLALFAVLAHFALCGCSHSQQRGVSSIGPRAAEVVLMVGIKRMVSLEEFFRGGERFSREGEPMAAAEPMQIKSIVTLEVTVSAPTGDLAFAVADWWLFQVTHCAAFAAETSQSGGHAATQVWRGHQLRELIDPEAVSHPMRPRVESASENGGPAIARAVTIIGVGCTVEELKLLTLLNPGPSADALTSWKWRAPPNSPNTPHAPLTVPPYDTWRYESLSPMFQFVPVGASPGIPAPPHPPNGGVL